MNDSFWDIFYIVATILLISGTTFFVFIIVIGIINICNTNKPKKKYYLIKCEHYFYFGKKEIIIKAQSPLKARLKFHKKHNKYDLISIEEIKDE